MKLKESDYREYKLASKGKKEKAALADICIFFLSILIVFGGIFLSVTDYFPLVGSYKAAYQEDTKQIMNFVDATRLQRKATDSTLVATDTAFKEVAKKLIRTTYYYHSNDETQALTYTELDENNNEKTVTLSLKDTINDSDTYDNDDLAYYFLSYRENNKDIMPVSYLLDSVDYSSNRYEFYYQGILKMTSASSKSYLEDNFVFNKPLLNTSILNKDTAVLLHKYVVLKKATNEGSDAYNYFYDIYKSAVSFGIDEIEKKNSVYISLLNTFLSDYASFKRCQTIPLSLAYVFCFLIFFVLLPLIFHNGQTLGMKIYHLQYERKDGNKPVFLNFFARSILLFISEIWLLALVAAILGQFSILTVTLWPTFRFLYLAVFSLIVGIASLITFFATKDQVFLNEWAGSLVVKDMDKFSPEKEEETKDDMNHEKEIEILTKERNE